MSNNKLKEAKSIEELLTIWKSKKLIIPDSDKALDIIKKHNYYRLSGYAKYFYISKEQRNFKSGTTFDDIYNLYLFDGELRSLIFKLTEEVELNFRSYIASYIADNFGPLGYLDSSKFFDIKHHEKFREIVKEKIEQYNKKTFIAWHIKTYNSNIPIWVLVEILSFSNLSKLYSNFKNNDQENIIKKNYSSKAITKNYISVRYWIHSICNVRNICAHSEKLFNLTTISLTMPKEYKEFEKKNNNLFVILIILKELILDQSKWNNFIQDLEHIIVKYNFSMFSLLGFSNDWKNKLKK